MDKKKKPDAFLNDVMAKPRDIMNSMQSGATDPNGSYTGVPKNRSEKPVQDADDL